MAERILIVDANSGHAVRLRDTVTAAGYEAAIAPEGAAAVAMAAQQVFDLILLELLLPGQSGIEVCREVRTRNIGIPIILLTASADTDDKVSGLQAGADDYVTKPYETRELLARIDALLRRSRQQRMLPVADFHFGNVAVDLLKGLVSKHGKPLNLSVKELHLLRYLIAHPDCVLSREELLHEVWGYRSTATRTVDMHVATLRQKLEDDPQHPVHIVTFRRNGYMFRASPRKEGFTRAAQVRETKKPAPNVYGSGG